MRSARTLIKLEAWVEAGIVGKQKLALKEVADCIRKGKG